MKTLQTATLIVLALPGSYLGGLGAADGWLLPLAAPSALPAQVFSAALHLSWICSAVRRGAAAVLLLCFPLSVWVCSRGVSMLTTHGKFWTALYLEAIPLVLAWSFAPTGRWAHRLARWRRARAAISAQLHLGPGLLPWARDCLGQALFGKPDRACASNHERFLAELADAECRLRVRLADLAVPEQLRQSLLSHAGAIRAQAELVSARLHYELEQQALAAAAACRDECHAIPGLEPGSREMVAQECESLIMGLTRQACAPALQEVL